MSSLLSLYLVLSLLLQVHALPATTRITPEKPRLPPLTCIHLLPRTRTNTDLGMLVRRNQIAFFLASHFRTGLSVPPIRSPTGGFHSSTFDDCGPHSDEDIPARCTFTTENYVYNVCPRRDCACMGRQFESKMRAFAGAGCSTVGVKNDAYERMEFCGCLRVLGQYVGNGDVPEKEYDAFHYPTEGESGATRLEAAIILKMMCKLSNRDIVVVVRKGTSLSTCGERLILADVDAKRAVQIFQHARVVGAGGSEMSDFLLELAKPERVVVSRRSARRFEWVDCDRWTIVDGADGSWHHFASRKDFVTVIMSSRDLKDERMTRKEGNLRVENYDMEVPRRVWVDGMMDL